MKRLTTLLLTLLAAVLLNSGVFALENAVIKHDNTKEEIVEIINKYPHNAFSTTDTQFSIAPSYTAPYSAGEIDKACLDDALNTLKVIRFLAGVPYEHIQFTDELNNISQHGAVLLAASNQFAHTPKKPDDMSEDFYKLAYKGCSEANLNAGQRNISNAVLGFSADLGQNNIKSVGHRRWILNPGTENFGIGFAHGTNANYGGYRTSVYVLDRKGSFSSEPDTYIAWPSAGAFPIQYFIASQSINSKAVTPWSISLGAKYAAPQKDKLVLKLTRVRDGKTWVFDKNTPNLGDQPMSNSLMHLSIDNNAYGMTKTIVFRPDVDSLGAIMDGDVFTVEISGIYDISGNSTTLNYSIEFFDLSKAINNKIILRINDRKANVFGEEKVNDVAPVIVNNRTMLPIRFIAENVGAEVLWNETEQKITILYKNEKIELFVNSDTAFVNGKGEKIDAPVFVQYDRTYVPVRFVSESLNFDVAWNEEAQEVTISVK